MFILSSTLFVDIEGFPVSYENYLNSFKARGEIGDEVMNSFIQVLNYESKMSSEVKPYVKKYCFTSYFTVIFRFNLPIRFSFDQFFFFTSIQSKIFTNFHFVVHRINCWFPLSYLIQFRAYENLTGLIKKKASGSKTW